jgi:urease alpha subunit
VCAGSEHPGHRQGRHAQQQRPAQRGGGPQTYEVFADGELLTCEPAEVLPMAQRYFLL